MHTFIANTPQLFDWIAQVMWPFLRIGAMFSIAPLFGSRTIPARIRIGVALALSVSLAPTLPTPPDIDVLSAAGVVDVAVQLSIGLSIGFMLQMSFASLQMAGELVATTMGLSMAQVTDPVNGGQVPVLGQLFFMTGMLLFLSMNGHLAMMSLVFESFKAMPIGATGLAGDDVWAMANHASSVFVAAVKVALPAVTALLAANVVLGVITRAAPQLNLFAFGLPITTALGLLLLLVTLPELTNAVRGSLQEVLALLSSIFLVGED
ncbi:MAG: flagellar biosynthetic protein FliR [Gammaproteobacteria bacterium]|jgi:flagellar biosynthetic protein FliR